MRKSIFSVVALVLSSSVNSAVITYGNLTTDDTTDYITDTTTGRQYLRFDEINSVVGSGSTIEDINDLTSSDSLYEGWSIATSSIADDFYSAALGVSSTPCSGATLTITQCGQLTNWVESSFGDPFEFDGVVFWYISTNDTPDVTNQQEAGVGGIDIDGTIFDLDDWSTFDETASSLAYDALLYRDVNPVPIPA